MTNLQPASTKRNPARTTENRRDRAQMHPIGEPEMLLIFQLSGEFFALPVNAVFEILDAIPATRVPNAPDHVRELINVRGSIVPLLDIRRRLQMPCSGKTRPVWIIVLELSVAGQPTRLAILVDSVEEVIEVDGANFEPIPELGARWPETFIRGVCTHRGSLVVLLDPETLFVPADDDLPVHSRA